MTADSNEQELVKSVLLKERAAFERLIRQYEGLVIHVVVSLIKNENDRDDICQEIFLKVYEKLGTFRFQSKLSTWIGNIAYNTSINYLQKRKDFLFDDIFRCVNTDGLEDLLNKTDTSTPERILTKKEEGKLLRLAVENLSGIQKTILVLFHQDELSLEEIAVIAEMPVNTVKSHLFRARLNLKEMLLHHKD